jgi:type II secretory pathway component GspD/PulD (secretin)
LSPRRAAPFPAPCRDNDALVTVNPTVSDYIVRMRGGTTVVLGDLIQTRRAANENKVPILGDIPLLGKLFTGKFRFNQKKELVIFVTPTIVQ